MSDVPFVLWTLRDKVWWLTAWSEDYAELLKVKMKDPAKYQITKGLNVKEKEKVSA